MAKDRKGLADRLLDKALDQVFDIHNFRIREPYKQVATLGAKKAYQGIKNSQVAQIVSQEPNFKALKNIFTRKVKPLKPEQIDEDSDLYAVLGVQKDSDNDTIKKAFKTMAAQFHPDKNPSPENEKIFKFVNRAFKVLSDQIKRSLYDQYGMASLQPGFDPSSQSGQ